jgi:flagellar motility protein MotE (MotC chaperone)
MQMPRIPRLLPLVAIAAGGVLAINAVENGPGLIGAARAFAEGATHQPPASATAAPSNATAPADPAAATPAKPAPICAESAEQIAKDAGLSPAELQIIQNLQSRRTDLDSREQGFSTQLALIQAAEAKVDAKIATLNQLKTDMQGMLSQLDAKQQAEVDRLVKVYSDMKPKDAAARFTLLPDAVRLPIASAMKEKVLAGILANMSPPDAKALTEALAARFLAQANAIRQQVAPPAAAGAPVATPAAAGAPAAPAPQQVAQATPPAAASPATARPPHHTTPHRRPPHPPTHAAGPALASSTTPGGTPAPATAPAATPAHPAASTPAATAPAAGHSG